MSRRAWVLNLDAEHELEAAGRFEPTQHLRAIVKRESQRLHGSLVAPGDVVLCDDRPLPQLDASVIGCAWSPTPRARRLLESTGAHVPDTPSLEVLRSANARAFGAEIRAPLVREGFDKFVAASLEAALEQLALPTPLGWLVRRSFGAAGRGRRRIQAGRPEASDLAWLRASLRSGPLTLEPWVEVLVEYTRSGLVRRDGTIEVSGPCLQETTRAGAWLTTAQAQRDELRRSDDARLEEAAWAAGRALAELGYFGPFGIDGYRHRQPGARSREALNPLSEINARYTMDWTTALGRRLALPSDPLASPARGD